MAPLAADSACEIPHIDGVNSRSAMRSIAQSRITRPCEADHGWHLSLALSLVSFAVCSSGRLF